MKTEGNACERVLCGDSLDFLLGSRLPYLNEPIISHAGKDVKGLLRSSHIVDDALVTAVLTDRLLLLSDLVVTSTSQLTTLLSAPAERRRSELVHVRAVMALECPLRTAVLSKPSCCDHSITVRSTPADASRVVEWLNARASTSA